jgi:hypothetical protein
MASRRGLTGPLIITVLLAFGCGSPHRSPSVRTGPAVGVAATFATLTGNITASGSDARYHFDYGTTPSYGYSTADTAVADSAGLHVATTIYTGLAVSTTYHYRVVQTYRAGGVKLAINGADRTLNTQGCTTSASPGANLQQFINSLGAGTVGCLHGGVYGSTGVTAASPNSQGTITDITAGGSQLHPIEVLGYPGESAPKIVGTMILLGGSHVTLSGLSVHGPTGNVGNSQCDDRDEQGQNVLIWIYGQQDQVDHNEIDRDLCHAGLYVGTRDGHQRVTGTRLIANYVHDNGDFGDSGQAHLDQGAYVADGSALIANNVVEHNLAFGVQLYPHPTQTETVQNTVVDNGESGILVGGDGSDPPPSGNRILFNISVGNGWNAPADGYGIRSGSDYQLGSGNVVAGNLVFGNSAAPFADPVGGLQLGRNVIADPLFTGTLGGGPSAYTTSAASPAIDAADRTQPQDFLNQPRGPDAADLGAYENPGR